MTEARNIKKTKGEKPKDAETLVMDVLARVVGMTRRSRILLFNFISAIVAMLLMVGLLTGTAVALEKNELDVGRVGVGAAVLGMGGCQVAMPNDAYSALLNPAGLSRISVIKATSMYASLSKEFDYSLASGILPLGKYGTIGLSYTGASTDADYKRDNNGNPEGKMGYADTLLQLSWGIPLRKIWRPHLGEERMAVGAALKFYQKGFTGTALSSSSASGMGLDLGYTYKINKWSNMGVVWKNILLNSVNWESGTTGVLPSVIKVGYAANIIGIDAPYIFGAQKVMAAADLDIDLSNEGGTRFHIGAEYWPLEYLAFRTGLDQSPYGNGTETNMTFGLGLNYGTIGFDYAYHPYASMPENDTHYFSISYINNNNEKHFVIIETPNDKFVTLRDKITISGTVIDSDVSKLLINEELVTLDKDKNFSKEIKLATGKNITQVIAVDEYGYVLEAIDLRQLRLSSFADVQEKYWASLPIRQLATLELVNGYPNGDFKPDTRITRAEVTTLIAKAREARPIGKPVSLFNDMESKHWANPFVNGGFALGLVTGYPDGSFGPKKNITRAEGVALITRFDGIKIPEKVDESPYDDVHTEHWVAPLVTVAKAAGLLDYLKSSRFEDKKLLTRAETVEILSKTEYVKKKLNDLYDWDSYAYQPKEKIVVERQAVTMKIDKLKIIDDAAEVQTRLIVAKKIRKEKEQEANALKFQQVTEYAQVEKAKPSVETVYDAYLPYDKKENKKIKVAAIEVASKPKVVKIAKVEKPVAEIKKKEVKEIELASKTVVKDTPEKTVAQVETKKKPGKVYTALKGALLGRWLVAKEKTKEVTTTAKNKDIYLHKANAIEASPYADQVQIKLGPESASTKLYIKCSIPEEAKVTKISALVKDTDDSIKLFRRTDKIWAAVYYISPYMDPGEHEMVFSIEADTGAFPDITKTFVSE
ncbi:S-layer homology domain-containing protein [Candidatus Margulisiibacteriota bacterium]